MTNFDLLEILIQPRKYGKGCYMQLVNLEGKMWHICGYFEREGNILTIEQLNKDLPKLVFDVKMFETHKIEECILIVKK